MTFYIQGSYARYIDDGTTCIVEDTPPEDRPATVTLFLSPPKSPMLFLTQVKAATWSRSPMLPGRISFSRQSQPRAFNLFQCSIRKSNQNYQPMIGNHPNDSFSIHEIVGSVEVRICRSGNKSSAMEPNNHRKKFSLLYAGIVQLHKSLYFFFTVL